MTDWQIIKQQAEKYQQTNTEWTSFIQGRRYKIELIEENRIFIKKVSGGYSVSLTKSRCISAINKIKIQKNINKSQLISESVARETSLVYLHPFLNWDSKNKQIFWKETISTDIATQFIEEASNDVLDKMQIVINKRKNQSHFRKNLLKVYENKCSITNTEITSVLQAAHIISHSESGNNESTNGILLRADLHILFDENLLLIHPKKLTVHLHPDLKNTNYSIFESKKIRQRIDNKNPDEKYLMEKWNKCGWINPIL